MCSVLFKELFEVKLSVVLKRFQHNIWGWSGGAKVLGKLPVLGRPTNLDYSWGKGLLCLH